MDIIRTSLLSAGQADEIKELLNGCRDSKGQTPFFPFEDGDLFYLLFTETDDNAASRILACAAALSFFEESGAPYAECSAFTRPVLRQKGYFSLLFDELSQDIEEVDLYFPVTDPEPGTLAALASLEAVRDRDEYRMELELELECAKAFSGAPFQETSAPGTWKVPGSRLHTQWEETEHDSFLLSFYQEEKAVGNCCLSFFGDSACFYSFEIKEELRGLGLGWEALSLTLSLLLKGLPRPGCRRLSLHVSGLNTPAISLYRKAGFHIKESLSYYLY